ncbi:HTH domain-containing protein [Curtobacterium sp. PhB136]|uniref:HTH domain-containing protein n=1 Tax=Curtobacterium sp. PhB136 TaxID=2485181 RepID=UPI0010E0EB62|nr:HTH domain-containing protein [Curtobacterium sp. PhB136]TCK61346.1 hypothetical protein EDF27_3059 [Curtobacterium sp. PhB136]
MTEKQDVAHELRHIVEVDGVPYDTIGAITGTTPEKLRSYVETSPNGFADPADGGLSPDEGARVSVLVAHLSAVKEIPDAERVEGMLAVLTQTFGFPVDALASVIGVEAAVLDDLATTFDDLPATVRTAVALRLSFLVNAINLASPTS